MSQALFARKLHVALTALGFRDADKARAIKTIMDELQGYVVVPAAPLMKCHQALVEDEVHEAYHQLRTAADPMMLVALGNDGNHWAEWQDAARARDFIDRMPVRPQTVREQLMDTPSKPVVVAPPEPVSSTMDTTARSLRKATLEEILDPAVTLAVPCECLHRMGNDYYHLPRGQCLRADGHCSARVPDFKRLVPRFPAQPLPGETVADCFTERDAPVGAGEHSEVLRSCGITPEGDGGEHACVMEAIRNG